METFASLHPAVVMHQKILYLMKAHVGGKQPAVPPNSKDLKEKL